jgi:predicted alpha/beta superfamily hydrolase
LPISPYLPQIRYFQAVPAQNRQGHTLTGDIRSLSRFHSRYLKTDRDVLVYLPPGYETDRARRYPVLYLQDGQNLFDGATSFIPGQEWRVDETVETLIHTGQIEPLIVVAIYNAGKERINEYTPTRDPSLHQGGKARLYGKMLTQELKPLVDAQYRTLPDAAHTGVGGSSLGGLLSLYLGLTYPKVFGRLAIMSPSLWWNHQDIIRQFEALPHKLPLRIWLDTGTNEGRNPEHITADARRLRDVLQQKGWRIGTDLAYMEALGAGHNENAWAERMDKVLRFLYPAQ